MVFVVVGDQSGFFVSESFKDFPCSMRAARVEENILVEVKMDPIKHLPTNFMPAFDDLDVLVLRRDQHGLS